MAAGGNKSGSHKDDGYGRKRGRGQRQGASKAATEATDRRTVQQHQSANRSTQAQHDHRTRFAGDTTVHDAVRKAMSTQGRPLPDSLKPKLEATFGCSLPPVQLHTGIRARNACQTVGKPSFTIGSHIFIDTTTIDLETAQGKRVIAHEMAHVCQQQQIADSVQRSLEAGAPIRVLDDDRYESDATQAEATMLNGGGGGGDSDSGSGSATGSGTVDVQLLQLPANGVYLQPMQNLLTGIRQRQLDRERAQRQRELDQHLRLADIRRNEQAVTELVPSMPTYDRNTIKWLLTQNTAHNIFETEPTDPNPRSSALNDLFDTSEAGYQRRQHRLRGTDPDTGQHTPGATRLVETDVDQRGRSSVVGITKQLTRFGSGIRDPLVAAGLDIDPLDTVLAQQINTKLLRQVLSEYGDLSTFTFRNRDPETKYLQRCLGRIPGRERHPEVIQAGLILKTLYGKKLASEEITDLATIVQKHGGERNPVLARMRAIQLRNIYNSTMRGRSNTNTNISTNTDTNTHAEQPSPAQLQERWARTGEQMGSPVPMTEPVIREIIESVPAAEERFRRGLDQQAYSEIRTGEALLNALIRNTEDTVTSDTKRDFPVTAIERPEQVEQWLHDTLLAFGGVAELVTNYSITNLGRLQQTDVPVSRFMYGIRDEPAPANTGARQTGQKIIGSRDPLAPSRDDEMTIRDFVRNFYLGHAPNVSTLKSEITSGRKMVPYLRNIKMSQEFVDQMTRQRT